MKKKRVAIVDKTGRGHSICDAFIRNNPDIEIFYIPGTGGVFDSRITTVQGILIWYRLRRATISRIAYFERESLLT